MISFFRKKKPESKVLKNINDKPFAFLGNSEFQHSIFIAELAKLSNCKKYLELGTYNIAWKIVYHFGLTGEFGEATVSLARSLTTPEMLRRPLSMGGGEISTITKPVPITVSLEI